MQSIGWLLGHIYGVHTNERGNIPGPPRQGREGRLLKIKVGSAATPSFFRRKQILSPPYFIYEQPPK